MKSPCFLVIYIAFDRKKNQLVVRRLQQLVFAHRRPIGSSLDAASTIGWSVDACQEARMVEHPTCWVKDGAQDGLTGLTIRWLKFPMFPWSNNVKSNLFDGKSSQCFHGKSFFSKFHSLFQASTNSGFAVNKRNLPDLWQFYIGGSSILCYGEITKHFTRNLLS